MPPAKPLPFGIRALLIVAIFVLFLFIYVQSIHSVSFHYDENNWIYTSINLETIAAEGANSRFWGENYWTLTQPPMARYLIAIGHKQLGIEPSQSITPWNFAVSEEENIALGRMPSPEVLFASRLPMAILAAISGTIIFAILWFKSGLLAGLLFALFFSSSDYLKTQLCRAMGESPLLFFLVLAALFNILAVERFRNQISQNRTEFNDLRTYLLFLLSGVFCGLAGASKINGLIAGAGMAALIVFEIFLFSPQLNKEKKLNLTIRFIFLTAFGALAAFIAVNPYLYANPFANVGRMYKFRLEEMAFQITQYPQYHIASLGNRTKIILPQVFGSYMPFQFAGAVPVYLALVLTGFISVIKPYMKGNTNLNHVPTGIIMLPLVFSGYMTPLNWDRYLLPCIMFNMIYAPIGLAAIFHWLHGSLRRKPVTG